MSNQVYLAKQKLIDQKREITSEAIRNLVLGKDERKRMVIEIFQIHNDQMAALVGKEFAPATLTRYKTCLKHTQSFIESKSGKPDLAIKK